MSYEQIVQTSRNGEHAANAVCTPNLEVVPKAERRRFAAECALRILAEADACPSVARLAPCCAPGRALPLTPGQVA